MHVDTSGALARAAVRRLGESELDPDEFFHEVSARVRRVVPHVGSAWLTLDPDTLLPGGTLHTDQSPEVLRALWRNELLVPDVHKLAELARRPSPVAALSELDAATAVVSSTTVRVASRQGNRIALASARRSFGPGEVLTHPRSTMLNEVGGIYKFGSSVADSSDDGPTSSK